MDRFTSLTVFARVVETGGFSAAARRLGMSVTMASNHIRALEDRLGARLLNRTTRKVSLTEVGRAYYERVQHILTDMEDADRLADALQGTPRGTLRLYASSALAQFLAPIMSEFLSRHPKVSFDLTIGERMIDMVEEGYDLAIRPVPPPDSSLIVRRLTPWRHILCASPAYVERRGAPQRPADLHEHDCLQYAFYPFGDEWRFEGEDDEPVSVKVSGGLVTNSGEVLRQLCLDGHGIFLAPPFIVGADVREGRLVPLLESYRPVEFSINAMYPHRHHLSAKVRQFIDLLAKRFAAHRQWMEPNGPG